MPPSAYLLKMHCHCFIAAPCLNHKWTRSLQQCTVLTSYFDSWLLCETLSVNAMNETATESREMSPPDVTSRAFQHRCRQRNWGVPMAHWLLIQEGENECEREKLHLFLSFFNQRCVSSELRLLNEVCGCLREWEYLCGFCGCVSLCFFMSSLNLSCVYLNPFIWKAEQHLKLALCCPPQTFSYPN